MSDLGSTSYFCWASLLIGLVFQILTIVSGFARDTQMQNGEAV